MPARIGRALFLVLALAASAALAKGPAVFNADQVQPNGLTREQARQVLVVVLKHERYKLGMPGVFIDGDLADEKGNPPHPGYFDFSLGYDSPKAGATEYMGLFSVSTATGDVWEINICKRFVFPALRSLQSGIMARTGRTMADEMAQRRGLGCTDE
jgi:hypothetical protein